LAVGYLWLAAGWVLFAPAFPDSKHATGLVADAYRLAGALGRPAALAALSFGAYLVGVFSVAVMNGIMALGNRFLSGKLRLIHAGTYSRTSTLSALVTPILRRLSQRFVTDEEMRRDIENKIEEILGRARQVAHTPSATWTEKSASDLVISMVHSPYQCATMLADVLDLKAYARELEWEASFIGGNALPEILERADRLRAEGEFRFGVVLPIVALCATLSLREGPLHLGLLCIPVWLTYLANSSYDKARSVAIEAVATERIGWPSLDRVVSGPIRFRNVDVALTAVLDSDKRGY
jgi:hypothetical protein